MISFREKKEGAVCKVHSNPNSMKTYCSVNHKRTYIHRHRSRLNEGALLKKPTYIK